MKVIKEAIDNVAKVSCYQGDVPMVMAMEKDASDKRNDDIKKELDAHRKATGADEKKPFGGERESGFPKNMKNREALKKMKLSEKLFTESVAGEWSEKLYDWAHENFYTGGNEDLCLALIDDFISWLSEDEVKEFCIGNGYDEWFEDEYEESLTENNAAAENDQKWVDYDEKKYGRVSKQTARDIKRSGSRLIKDDKGEYEVVADESLTEETVGASMRPYLSKMNEGIFDTVKDKISGLSKKTKGTGKPVANKNAEGASNELLQKRQADFNMIKSELSRKVNLRDANFFVEREDWPGHYCSMFYFDSPADRDKALQIVKKYGSDTSQVAQGREGNSVGIYYKDKKNESLHEDTVEVGASMKPYLDNKENEENIDLNDDNSEFTARVPDVKDVELDQYDDEF